MNGRDLRFKRGKSNNRRFNTVRANKRESVGNRLRDANTLTVAPAAAGFTANHKTRLFGRVAHALHCVSGGPRVGFNVTAK